MRGLELRSGCYRGDSGQVQYIHPSTAAVHYRHADCSIHKKNHITIINTFQVIDQGFIQRGGKLGFPSSQGSVFPPQESEKNLLLYIEKSVQIVNDDK